jgi:dTDP-4-amino-4,6-dideoxygalactose transaminase
MPLPEPPAEPIPLSRPSFDHREREALARALEGRVSGDGPFCRRVEARLAELLEGRRVLLTTSCTHAMELALLAIGVRPGQQVVCPSFTFSSTANAVLRVGGWPVFADIDASTLGLDPADVERRLGPATAGILPVHYGGVAVDMEGLQALARQRGLWIVEDAAQALAARYRGRPLGALGDAGCFSFHETKNITCGEGGALVIGDPELADRAEVIREKGTNRRAFLRGQVDKYSWVAEGSSYVLSDLLAAVLDAQLDKLDEIQRRRRSVVERYRTGLADWAAAHGVRFAPRLPEREDNAHLFYMLLPDEASRDRCLDELAAAGVAAAFHFVPLHSAPFGRELGADATRLPVTDRVAATLLRLPLFPQLSDEQVERVIAAVAATLG